MSTEKLTAGEATVQDIAGGYHLVTYGEWQVSVMNDGMISLPRIVRPQDVDDFVQAMLAAKPVGLAQQETNEAAAATQRKQIGVGRANASLRNRSAPRARGSLKAKADKAARAGGPRGSRKSELAPTTNEES